MTNTLRTVALLAAVRPELLSPEPVVKADDFGHVAGTVLRRTEPVVAGIVARQSQSGLASAIQEPLALEPDVAAAVEDAVGLEQLEIAGLRLEREDLPRVTGQLRRQNGEVADMGTDVDDAIAGHQGMEHKTRLGRLPDPVLSD